MTVQAVENRSVCRTDSAADKTTPVTDKGREDPILPTSTGSDMVSEGPTHSLEHITSVAQKMILEQFTPASVVVNELGEALYSCGSTTNFLETTHNSPTQHLLSMAHEGLRPHLRLALDDAASSALTVTVHGARMKCGNAQKFVQITVTPDTGSTLGPLYLVVFRYESADERIPEKNKTTDSLIGHLEKELLDTRNELAGCAVRFSCVNDTLKNSNEEVVSANEELRVMNEELESSKEELQSLNAELNAVNQELESKIAELEISNSDLHNLLISSDIATICLDQTLCIKWFAPVAQQLFHLISTDVGRPVSDLLSAIEDHHLISAAHQVLLQKKVLDHEFQVANGCWYIRRIRPYQNQDAQNDGLIVTYTDISDIHWVVEMGKATRRDLDENIEKTDKLNLLSAALATAEERERRALAKYLHDDLGQILAVIALKTVTIKKQEMPDSVRLAISDCSAAVELANGKLREMALQLNPPMLDQLGLVKALEWMADEIHRVYKLDVSILDDGIHKPLSPPVSATMLRAVRELLINVCRHAHVKRADITTSRQSDMLILTVSDSGTGFDQRLSEPATDDKALGLISLSERISLLGGEVSIESSPGQGTTVTLKVPLLETASSKNHRQQGKQL